MVRLFGPAGCGLPLPLTGRAGGVLDELAPGRFGRTRGPPPTGAGVCGEPFGSAGLILFLLSGVLPLTMFLLRLPPPAELSPVLPAPLSGTPPEPQSIILPSLVIS